jgi:hypothetical protein
MQTYMPQMNHINLAVLQAMMSFSVLATFALRAYHTTQYQVGEILYEAVSIETSAAR